MLSRASPHAGAEREDVKKAQDVYGLQGHKYLKGLSESVVMLYKLQCPSALPLDANPGDSLAGRVKSRIIAALTERSPLASLLYHRFFFFSQAHLKEAISTHSCHACSVQGSFHARLLIWKSATVIPLPGHRGNSGNGNRTAPVEHWHRHSAPRELPQSEGHWGQGHPQAVPVSPARLQPRSSVPMALPAALGADFSPLSPEIRGAKHKNRAGQRVRGQPLHPTHLWCPNPAQKPRLEPFRAGFYFVHVSWRLNRVQNPGPAEPPPVCPKGTSEPLPAPGCACQR